MPAAVYFDVSQVRQLEGRGELPAGWFIVQALCLRYGGRCAGFAFGEPPELTHGPFADHHTAHQYGVRRGWPMNLN